MIFQTYHTGGNHWSWHLQLDDDNYVLVNPVYEDDHSEPDCSNFPSGELSQVCMFGIYSDATDDHEIKVCTMAEGLEWLGTR
jgi:hypothetical protein